MPVSVTNRSSGEELFVNEGVFLIDCLAEHKNIKATYARTVYEKGVVDVDWRDVSMFQSHMNQAFPASYFKTCGRASMFEILKH